MNKTVTGLLGGKITNFALLRVFFLHQLNTRADRKGKGLSRLLVASSLTCSVPKMMNYYFRRKDSCRSFPNVEPSISQ